MTAADLVMSLAAEIRSATSGLTLPVEYHNERERRQEKTWRKVQVFEQMIPKDLFKENSYYPCVVVEWLSTTDQFEGSNIATVADIALSCGVFAKEERAWIDAFDLMEEIRRCVLSKRTLNKRFRLWEEIRWQTAQQQPTPFYFVYGELSYLYHQVEEPFNEIWKEHL